MEKKIVPRHRLIRQTEIRCFPRGLGKSGDHSVPKIGLFIRRVRHIRRNRDNRPEKRPFYYRTDVLKTKCPSTINISPTGG